MRQKKRKPHLKDKEKGWGVLEKDGESFSADKLSAENAKKSPHPLRIIVGQQLIQLGQSYYGKTPSEGDFLKDVWVIWWHCNCILLVGYWQCWGSPVLDERMFSTSWGQSALTSGDILAPRAALIVWWKQENTETKHDRGKLQGIDKKTVASAWKWMMTDYANEVLIVRCWKQVSRVDYAAQALSRTHLATALLMSLGAFQREQKREGEVVRNYEETLPNSFILPASYNNPFTSTPSTSTTISTSLTTWVDDN